MKKIVFLTLFILSVFVFIPTKVDALSIDNYVDFAAKTPKITSSSDINDLMDEYDEDAYQSCEGNDSVLGNPDDPDSVAWLLDQILTYSTIAGMLLVVVLSSIDFLTVIVKSDDESMNKAARKLGLRLVFAILLFFVPSITNAILDIFGLTSQSTCGLQQ